MAKLIFYRLSEDAKMKEASAYSNQDLQLSKYFAKWPGQ